jgi:hypothetical protein
VTAAAGGAPIPGDDLLVEDNAGHDFPFQADANGYYTQTLLAGTYTVASPMPAGPSPVITILPMP